MGIKRVVDRLREIEITTSREAYRDVTGGKVWRLTLTLWRRAEREHLLSARLGGRVSFQRKRARPGPITVPDSPPRSSIPLLDPSDPSLWDQSESYHDYLRRISDGEDR